MHKIVLIVLAISIIATAITAKYYENFIKRFAVRNANIEITLKDRMWTISNFVLTSPFRNRFFCLFTKFIICNPLNAFNFQILKFIKCAFVKIDRQVKNEMLSTKFIWPSDSVECLNIHVICFVGMEQGQHRYNLKNHQKYFVWYAEHGAQC